MPDLPPRPNLAAELAGAKAKGDLRLDRPSDAVVPGKPAESTLIERITAGDDDGLRFEQRDRVVSPARWVES